MVKMIASTAAVVALMPVIWVTSATWAAGLSVGLVAHEVKRRIHG
jgi:hypothetical protein